MFETDSNKFALYITDHGRVDKRGKTKSPSGKIRKNKIRVLRRGTDKS